MARHFSHFVISQAYFLVKIGAVGENFRFSFFFHKFFIHDHPPSHALDYYNAHKRAKVYYLYNRLALFYIFLKTFLTELKYIIYDIELCPVHLPGQNIFCPGQNQICPRQNDFVHDKIFFVHDKNFVHSLKIIFALRKLV